MRWAAQFFSRGSPLAIYEFLVKQNNNGTMWKVHEKRATCRASAGDVVTATAFGVYSPHLERVTWSRMQTIHFDYWLCSWLTLWMADKTVHIRWFCSVPTERQRSICWPHKCTPSLNTWRCVKRKHTQTHKDRCCSQIHCRPTWVALCFPRSHSIRRYSGRSIDLANLQCDVYVQANSASYPQRDGKWVLDYL